MKYPGNAITIKEETFITPQAAVVTAPAASEGDVTGTYIQVQAPGGGGADSDTDGANAGYCEIGLTVDNVFYTIRVNGGSGATQVLEEVLEEQEVVLKFHKHY